MMFSTFAEQDYFTYPHANVYSGVVVNANMAAHAPSGLASFIVEKLHAETKYVVDPITHAFQHDTRHVKAKASDPDSDVKSSIRTLADAYGAPISDLVGKRPAMPEDFDDAALEALTSQVLDFQRTHLRAYMERSDAAKYLDESDIKGPDALIAPYFYITEIEGDDWLEKNVDCLRAASSALRDGERLFAEIVVEQGVLLDSDRMRRVVAGYEGVRDLISGCFVWVDSLDEETASILALTQVREFCAALRSFLPEVINLHGGYFSILIGSDPDTPSLTGVTHGPEFGEFRSVVPVGGGIPIARYYVPRLHSRVRYREAAALFNDAGWLDSPKQFVDNVCDCRECLETLGDDPGRFTKFGEGEVKDVKRRHGMVRIEYPTSATKLRCLRHYLQR